MITLVHAPRQRWRLLVAVVLGSAVVAVPGAFPAAAAAPEGFGEIYVIHGLAGVTADVVVDDEVLQEATAAGTIVGPVALEPGSHTVTLEPTDGEPLSATVEVAAGSSADVVGHSRPDVAAGPVLTVFPNDLSAVGAGKSRLVVAHTAVVPPADVRVNGEVLFSNVANAESLELVVPAATYSVDIVPTGTSSPVVFGPVDLAVEAGTLTRVFAFGDPTQQPMDVVVQVLPVAQDGAAAPESMPMGNGGQAAGDLGANVWLGALAAALAAVVALGHAKRHQLRRAPLAQRRRGSATLPD